MRKWFVKDREGREIYLTEEQWQHIISRHGELRQYLNEVLNTVKYGKRKQQPQDPQAYVYRQACDSLPPPFNGITVVVVFHFEQSPEGYEITNNFMVTAWGIMMRR